MKAYLNEFASFDNGPAFDTILAAISSYGFKDHSWHNDAMPCILLEHDHGFQLVIWVDYKDLTKAEFPEQRLEGKMKQFMFGERDEDGEYTEEWHYDDIDALISHVKKVMES
ncbi:MAG: hypothetical protein RMX26_08435 [Planktomarina sp.]|nr:hypothetical protein [Planktomarina sp.]|tara:strand:+ start:108 stop:443 length:336 start_codon:yes stop_codon:yes gene_type:complete